MTNFVAFPATLRACVCALARYLGRCVVRVLLLLQVKNETREICKVETEDICTHTPACPLITLTSTPQYVRAVTIRSNQSAHNS